MLSSSSSCHVFVAEQTTVILYMRLFARVVVGCWPLAEIRFLAPDVINMIVLLLVQPQTITKNACSEFVSDKRAARRVSHLAEQPSFRTQHLEIMCWQ